MNVGDRVSFQMPPSDNGEVYPVRHGQIHRDWQDGWVEVVVGRTPHLVKKEWIFKNGEQNARSTD